MYEVKEKVSKLVQQKCWKDARLNEARMKELAKDVELSFEDVLLMTKYLMPDQHVSLMNVYATSVKKLQHVRDAFEYATLYEQFDVLANLIDMHKEDELLLEWVRVYQLLYDLLNGNINIMNEDSIQMVRNMYAYTNNPITRMRLEYIELNLLFKKGTLRGSNLIESRMRNIFKSVEPCFIKSVLASKCSLLIGLVKLYYEGDLEKAENHLLAVVVNESSTEAVLSACHHALGQIYLARNNSELCKSSYKKAIDYAAQATLSHYKESLENEYYPFARNILGEVFETNNVVLEERIHQHIVRGEKEEALHLIDLSEKTSESSSFMLFYKGKLKKDKSLLLQSMESFSCEGELYFYKFVEKELIKLIQRR